jgi:hypothetical protein
VVNLLDKSLIAMCKNAGHGAKFPVGTGQTARRLVRLIYLASFATHIALCGDQRQLLVAGGVRQRKK